MGWGIVLEPIYTVFPILKTINQLLSIKKKKVFFFYQTVDGEMSLASYVTPTFYGCIIFLHWEN